VITAHGPVDTVWPFFFEVISAYHMEIGGFGASWELMDSNKLHGVGSRDGIGALC